MFSHEVFSSLCVEHRMLISFGFCSGQKYTVLDEESLNTSMVLKFSKKKDLTSASFTFNWVWQGSWNSFGIIKRCYRPHPERLSADLSSLILKKFNQCNFIIRPSSWSGFRLLPKLLAGQKKFERKEKPQYSSLQFWFKCIHFRMFSLASPSVLCVCLWVCLQSSFLSLPFFLIRNWPSF